MLLKIRTLFTIFQKLMCSKSKIFGIMNSVSQIITVRNEVAKVMFLQVSVYPQRGVPGPGGCLVLGGAESREVPGPGGCVCLVLGGGVVSQHALRQNPPGETATAADGTHPTGMHSS